MTKCYECKYEHSDCKGNKQDDCPNFAKRGAFNYHAKIRELEKTLEQADKRELIKALAHDREQYDKGYKQGYEDCQKEIEESLGLLWKGGVKNG